MKEALLEFSTISKKDWIEKITKDLKGKDINSLYWNYNKDFLIDPFPHRDDIQEEIIPLRNNSDQNNWKIGTGFQLADETITNAQLRNFLKNGLDYAKLRVDTAWDIPTLLDEVQLDLIAIDFAIDSSIGLDTFFDNLKKYLVQNSYDIDSLEIGFIWEGSNDASQDFYRLCKLNFPQSNYIHIYIDNNPKTGLSDALTTVHQMLKADNKESLLDNMVFHISVNEILLFEIARIRAFKVLWSNLLKNMGVGQRIPQIIISPQENEGISDKDDNMILLTVQTLIAVSGGVSAIMMSEVVDNRESSFYSRIIMNIQHIMKLESKLDIVQDPVAGSYHFEKLTNSIIEQSWQAFVNK